MTHNKTKFRAEGERGLDSDGSEARGVEEGLGCRGGSDVFSYLISVSARSDRQRGCKCRSVGRSDGVCVAEVEEEEAESRGGGEEERTCDGGRVKRATPQTPPPPYS